MASTWAKGLPVVAVRERLDVAKSVTLIYPYYENKQFLERQRTHWFAMSAYLMLLPFIQVIVVDDGSSLYPAAPPVDGPTDFRERLFRIAVDVPWNWLAARNIGAHHATTDWLLMTDMDHMAPYETLRSVVYGQHDPAVVYAFSRREHTGEAIQPHSASFLMTRAMFWRIGGYDETLSGYYGTDGEFRRRIAKHAPIQVLTDALVRHEYVADASTSRLARKLPADAAAVKRLVAARGKHWTPKVLSFPYQEVSCSAS